MAFSQRIDDYRHAFAIATGTTVNGMHFKQLLEQAASNCPNAEGIIDSEVAKKVRDEAKGFFLGVDDIIIPEDARVEKVEDGYWVEARVGVDAYD